MIRNVLARYDHGYVSFVVDHNLVLSSFMTYHWVCNEVGPTSGIGTAYPSGAPE